MQPPEPTPAEIAKLEKVAEDSTRWIDGVLDHYKVGTRDPESVPTYLRDTAFKLADANYYLSMAVRWLQVHRHGACRHRGPVGNYGAQSLVLTLERESDLC